MLTLFPWLQKNNFILGKQKEHMYVKHDDTVNSYANKNDMICKKQSYVAYRSEEQKLDNDCLLNNQSIPRKFCF